MHRKHVGVTVNVDEVDGGGSLLNNIDTGLSMCFH